MIDDSWLRCVFNAARSVPTSVCTKKAGHQNVPALWVKKVF